jgi:importin subunit alpha-1
MSSRERQEQRKKDFKKGIDADDARKKREEVSVTIRKSKREESLLKKRNVTALATTKVVDAGVAQKVFSKTFSNEMLLNC